MEMKIRTFSQIFGIAILLAILWYILLISTGMNFGLFLISGGLFMVYFLNERAKEVPAEPENNEFDVLEKN